MIFGQFWIYLVHLQLAFLAPDLFNPLAVGFFAPVSLIFGARYLASGTVPSDLLTAGLFVPDLLDSPAAGIFDLLKTHVADSLVLFSDIFTVCFYISGQLIHAQMVSLCCEAPP